MAATGGKIQFFYDVVSPWAYLGFEILMRYARQYPKQVRVELCPFFLGGVMQLTGNKPPITVPAKGQYMFQDLQRCGSWASVSMKLPEKFPINTITAQRILVAAKQTHPQFLEGISRSLWQSFWGQGNDISQNDEIRKCMLHAGVPVRDADDLLLASQDMHIKQNLKDITQNAVDRGAFGAPTMFVQTDGKSEENMYWGSDRFFLVFPQLGVPWNGPNPFGAKL